VDHQEEEEGNEAQEEGESHDVPLASVQKNYGCSWDPQDQFELEGIYTRGCDSESDCSEDDDDEDGGGGDDDHDEDGGNDDDDEEDGGNDDDDDEPPDSQQLCMV